MYAGDKPILVGYKNYTGTDQPFVYQERVFGLDTSCVLGKALTGMLLPAFRFESVPSRANHWMQVRRMYPKPGKQLQSRPASIAWADAEEMALVNLIEKVYQTSEAIMLDLQSRPGYADLRPREQARLFGERIEDGRLATLLQLARLGKLNVELAHKILKTPDELQDAIHSIMA